MQLQGETVQFKLDTGAEVTAISTEVHQHIGSPTLSPPSKVLYGPARQTLNVLGQFQGTLRYGEHTFQETISVVDGLRTNLLGLQAITALRLIQRICDTTAEEEIFERFPNVFNGLGTIGEEYEIKLKENATPYALQVPRNVPIPLRPKVKQELERMEQMRVISKVTGPSEWCAGMVVVPKRSGDVRICVDLKPLNESVLREPHPIPKVDDTLALLSGAVYFSKLDANSGFWQIPLSESSKPLTTFITPFGRYKFNKLPFGVSCAPELFQHRMNRILEGMEGVVVLMDDVLVFASTKEEHDIRLSTVLKRLEEVGATLNRAKCEIFRPTVRFLGHILDKQGIRADPEKTSAISKMKAPKSVSDVRRFMGLVNQLGKFSPKIAEYSQALRELLRSNRTWTWGPAQEESFARVKEELVKPTVLSHYNPQAETKVSADASSYGLGAVLMQKEGKEWKPVVYASRSLNDTERNYAQIEKEALATTWACKKFATYILGRPVTIESDHKPLIPLLNEKHLDALPPRILRFRLRMAKFDYVAVHVPGKLLYTADTLSRAPLPELSENDTTLQDQAECFIHNVTIPSLPASKSTLERYRQAQQGDEICSKVMEYCRSSWPDKNSVESPLKPFREVRGALTICEQLLLFNNRIVVPSAMRREALTRIHEGHQGAERCRWRTKSSVWWPGITTQVKQMVGNCKSCAKNVQHRREPLITTSLPKYPWEVVGTDLFELQGQQYLLVVDYFSRYPEVVKLKSTTTSSVIALLKACFARHGIPEVVRSDNGPQFASREFAEFANSYGFEHRTSSPRYPQSNGMVERGVKTVKKLLKQSPDPHLAVLSFRATPIPWCGLSPSELLMGRKIRTTVPQMSMHFIPKWEYISEFRQADKLFKESQKKNFDKRYRVCEQEDIPEGSDVWVNSGTQPEGGYVVAADPSPRSYLIATPSGEVRHNRSHIIRIPESTEQTDSPNEPGNGSTEPPRRIVTRSQTGTTILPPDQLS